MYIHACCSTASGGGDGRDTPPSLGTSCLSCSASIQASRLMFPCCSPVALLPRSARKRSNAPPLDRIGNHPLHTQSKTQSTGAFGFVEAVSSCVAGSPSRLRPPQGEKRGEKKKKKGKAMANGPSWQVHRPMDRSIATSPSCIATALTPETCCPRRRLVIRRQDSIDKIAYPTSRVPFRERPSFAVPTIHPLRPFASVVVWMSDLPDTRYSTCGSLLQNSSGRY
jgi:hypothetical protein